MTQLPETRLIVEPDGRAVLVRTPTAASLRFESLEHAARYDQAQQPMWWVVQVMVVGGLACRLLLPPDLLLKVFGGWFVLCMAALALLQVRMTLTIPRPQTLSWAEATAYDHHPVSSRLLLEAGGGAVGLLGLAALIGWVGDWDRLWWRDPGMFLVAAGAVSLMAGLALYMVVVLVGMVRFRRAQQR